MGRKSIQPQTRRLENMRHALTMKRRIPIGSMSGRSELKIQFAKMDHSRINFSDVPFIVFIQTVAQKKTSFCFFLVWGIILFLSIIFCVYGPHPKLACNWKITWTLFPLYGPRTSSIKSVISQKSCWVPESVSHQR